MLPNKPYLSPETCLTSLVGIQADCTDNQAFHYIEDIEGCDIKKISEIGNVQAPSGKSMAQNMIAQAAREMLGDIEMAGDGFQLRQTFGDICSACNFQSSYVAGGGAKVQNVIGSVYSLLKIFSIEVATNYTGSAVLVINDGKVAKTFDVELVAAEIITLKLDYQTDQKIVKISFADTAIQVSKIDCPTVRSCGCGGAVNATATDTIRYSGMTNGIDSSFQYGFKVCAAVVCDANLMTCDLIKQTPRAFALTLLYKVGAKYYSEAKLSDRINRFAGHDDDEKKDMVAYYNGLYTSRLRGKNDSKSIQSIIKNYLRNRNDRCVVCEAAKSISYATG